jgi:4-amino-4-deoxy-L-arabinose transferase-like glycosyltransferase
LRAVDVLLLSAILLLVLAWPLRSPPIGAHGEAREGLVVQDIVESGRWVLPRRNGELPSKPPFFHWVAAAAAEGFGLSDVTVRLPSALGAWAMALATFALGVRAGGRVTAWLAVGALLGMHGFWESASEARVDMVFAACVTLALVGFFLWHHDGSRAARVCCYLAAACAVLTKGPAGVLLPLLIVIAFLARGGLGSVRDGLARLTSWPLVAMLLAVDVGWYALACGAGGGDFLDVVLSENVDRFVGRGVFGMHGGRSPFALVVELATDLLPWNLVLVWAAVRWWRGEREDAVGRFLHAWWITLLVFFSVAYGKRGVYLLPLHPAIALLAARALGAALAVAPVAARLARLPVPARLARVAAAAPALARLALAVVVFDVVLFVVTQAAREYEVRRESLTRFAREISDDVPAGAVLYADADLAASDVQVLAYRLKRRIVPAAARASAPATSGGPAYCLVPAVEADAFARARYERLAVSVRRGEEVALLRAPADAGCTLGGAEARATAPRRLRVDRRARVS